MGASQLRIAYRALLGAAVLSLCGAGAALAGSYYCDGRQTTERTCPDGSLAIYQTEPLQPAPSRSGPSRPEYERQRPRPTPAPAPPNYGRSSLRGPGDYCGSQLTTARTCPNGEPSQHVALETHRITREEMAAMDENLRLEGIRIARIWTRNGQLTQSQLNAIERGTCVLIPSANPDMRCVGY